MAEHGFTDGKDIYNLTNILSRLSVLESRIKESYPVGSIYMSVRNTNPSQFFGGTWVQWGQGRVVVGMGGKYTSVEGTGGMEQEQLNSSQIPQHRHASKLEINPNSGLEGYIQSSSGKGFVAGDETVLLVDYTKKAGNPYAIAGGDYPTPAPVSKMQPYITCYMWKRTS